MRTLIELYDERPLENVLAAQVFKPERVVYVCVKRIAESGSAKKTIENYFKHCGVDTQVVMLPADHYSAQAMLETLNTAADTYPDCALDITGGTDQALFAAGMLFAEKHIPTFTWARRSNTFYPISGSPFEGAMPNTLQLSIDDYFVMAGGRTRMGRVDNNVLEKYLRYFEPFFGVYLKYKKGWASFVGWMQRASAPVNGEISLTVDSPLTIRGERGPITVEAMLLKDLEKLGFLKNVELTSDSVRFRFMDAQVRTWLRDIGSVLETYVYKMCLDAGTFTQVATSVVADWENGAQSETVSNEIDVMAVRGITPLFISCKTCEIKTEALNELSILKDRFGGQMARALIVTTSHAQALTRQRARELGILVADADDIRSGRLTGMIRQEEKQKIKAFD